MIGAGCCRLSGRWVDTARQLPFGAAQFDAVLDESVMALVPDKAKALAEYRRVTRPGGCVGLNQVSWVKTPPPDLVRYIGLIMAGADFLTNEGWAALLEQGGLCQAVFQVKMAHGFGLVVWRHYLPTGQGKPGGQPR